MTKQELTSAVVLLAGLSAQKANEAISRMCKATKEICKTRYDKVMAEANKEQAAKFVVMCCTGIQANGIDKNCTPIH